MKLTLDIADALVAHLADGTYSLAISPVRRIRPAYELADLDSLRVTVVPRAVEIFQADRILDWHQAKIDVAIQYRLDPTKTIDDAGDSLLTLVEEIADHVRREDLALDREVPPGEPPVVAHWISNTHDPLVALDHLDQDRVFTTILTVTYRVRR